MKAPSIGTFDDCHCVAGPICGVIAAGMEYGGYREGVSYYGERLRFAATYVSSDAGVVFEMLVPTEVEPTSGYKTNTVTGLHHGKLTGHAVDLTCFLLASYQAAFTGPLPFSHPLFRPQRPLKYTINRSELFCLLSSPFAHVTAVLPKASLA